MGKFEGKLPYFFLGRGGGGWRMNLDVNIADNGLKDFHCNSALLGLVYYNDPCQMGADQRDVVSTCLCYTPQNAEGSESC